MFGRGKNNSRGNNPPKSDQVRNQNQDLFGMPDLSAYAVPDEVDVSEDVLEAELAALLDEDEDDRSSQKQSKPSPRKPADIKKVDPMKQIAAMTTAAMKDISDEDVDDDDEDDENLLAELAGITEEEEKEASPKLQIPAAQPSSSKTPSPAAIPHTDIRPRPSPRPHPAPQPSPSSSLAPVQPAPRRSLSPARQSAPPATAPGPAKSASEPSDLGSLLQHRAQCYKQAIDVAESAGESSKVRRYKRQLKTLQDMQKKLKMGKPIDKEEIPPEVYVPQPVTDAHPSPQPDVPVSTSSPPSAPGSQQPPSQAQDIDNSTRQLLCVRRDQYKMAAVLAKKSDNIDTARSYLKIVKQFDEVIGAVEAGQEVDLSAMPPAPPSAANVTNGSVASQPQQTPSAGQAPAAAPPAPPRQDPAQPPSSGDGYARPKTDLEALVQRRDQYKNMADRAKEEQNESKARRIGRIVKQYEDAIRKEKMGKPVDLSELASLPEFPPFPSQTRGKPPQSSVPAAAEIRAPPATTGGQTTRAAQQASGQPSRPGLPNAPNRPQSAKENMYQRNIAILKSRIAQYRKLALNAKQKGDIYEAKRLLRIAKEIEPMLSAAEGGLPVNIDSIPKLPQAEESEPVAVSPPESPEPVEGYEPVGDAQEVYARLIATLQKQIEICKTNANTYNKLGNIKSVNRFKDFQEHCQQDLDVLRSKQSRREPIPRHHYEQRTLPSVRVCPDVKENEAEITIVQGLQLHCPNEKDAKDIDTYIRAEFPYPSDGPPTHKTGWAKGAEKPQYQSIFRVDINRNSRAFNSAIKRKSLKMEVIYSKGLLRGHKTLGTAALKLADLDSKCELHESVPLMEGRREIGGKIEIKVRIHHPLSGLKEDFVKEKWLIIDSIHKKAKSPQASSPKKPTGASTDTPGSSHRSSATDSIEVLKWEIATLKKKIAELQAHKQPVPKEFLTSYGALQERLQKLQTYLKEGGAKARQAYVSRLQAVAPNFLAQAKEAHDAGHKDRASMYMTKKKLVESEITNLTRR